MNTFHQGDVQGRKIQVLPEGAKIIKNTPLAYGEHSGHVHQITGEVELYEYDGKFIAVIGSDGAFLQHVHETTVAGKEKFNAPLPKADHHLYISQPGFMNLVFINGTIHSAKYLNGL